ncbi:MAG: chemotaxis protein CheW [Cyanobacteria bacterium]|nr:chemotaxis protein CheW [Cyanobacteriota bacterium]MDA0867463.1 chemotaxis protein CheW [Cyanobacteriota bacterium]
MTINTPPSLKSPPSARLNPGSAKGLNQFLQFHLLPNMTALLPVEQLTEILKVPLAQITPIPHVAPWIMGVHNWRGDVLWLVDLGDLLGLSPWHQQEQPPSTGSFIVLNACRQQQSGDLIEQLPLGLLVDRIDDIQWLNTDSLQSPINSMITDQLAPFICGYWLDRGGDMMTLLDGDAILDRMPS